MHRALSLLEDQLRQLPSQAPATDRARLLYALAGAALQAEAGVDALSATTEAIKLVPAEPPSASRAQVVNMHARANADRRRDGEAARWASTALDLGHRLQLPEIVADATATLARVDERAGAPEASRRALQQAAVDAAGAGEAAAELRALSTLAGLHYALGQLPEAMSVGRSAIERARNHGRPWAPYGLDARALAGIVAHTRGDWDEALAIVDVRDEAPPEMAEALLGAVRLGVSAGRGEHDGLQLFSRLRSWWPRDGQIAILSGAAAVDLHGDRAELAEATKIHDELVVCVGELWQHPLFQGRIRLEGLMLGLLCAEAARSGSRDLAALAGRGDQLAEAARATADDDLKVGHPLRIESQAWLARVEAEHLRLRWLTGVERPTEYELVACWRRSVAAFEAFGHRYETARSRARLAAALRSTGNPEEASEQAGRAQEVALQLRAAPLATELRDLAPGVAIRRSDARSSGSGSAEPRASDPAARGGALTGREREVLALLAAGRSNREIGEQLYISAKTVSVHVSNLMAKLGASGRTEAVALARRGGLLSDDASH